MAKRAKKQVGLTRKQIARSRKARRQQRMLILGLTVVSVVTAIVLGLGLYQEYVSKPASPVAVVNGVPIRTDTYQKMVRYRRFLILNYIANLQAQKAQLDPADESSQFLAQYFQQSIDEAQSQMTILDMQVLDDLIDVELIRQESVQNGLSVTEQEVNDTIRRDVARGAGFVTVPDATATAAAAVEATAAAAFFTPTPLPTATPTLTVTEAVSPTTPTPTVPPTPMPTPHVMTEGEFLERYKAMLDALRKEAELSEADYRRTIEAGLLYSKLQDLFASRAPTTEEQVHARHILVETEEEAQTVLARLEAGEDFVSVAKELSTDESTREDGGDLGWFPRGVMVPEFEETAFALQPGETSEILQTSFGYHIILVEERDLDRELEPYLLEQRQTSALSEWLEEQRQSEAVERHWSSDIVPPAAAGL
ncbi:MAG: peptidylprolyl isomerase [Anaerolineae bacterium]|nr:peptidylprolyl isomerase [Anaerolineae bacterium]